MAKITAPIIRFLGFISPSYTQVPDELFDALMVELSGVELKVLLYIIRRTFGFKRDSDTISLSQMLGGLRSRDGRQLDRGVGLTKKPLLAALRSLVERGVILIERRTSAERGNEPTCYRLNICTGTSDQTDQEEKKTPPPLGEKLHQGVGGETPPHKKQRKRQILRIFERLHPRFKTKRPGRTGRQYHHASQKRPQAQHRHPVAVHQRRSRRPSAGCTTTSGRQSRRLGRM